MSKTIGKVLNVLTMVAAVAFAPVSGGGTLIGLGIKASTGALIAAGLAAASMVNNLLMPKAKQQARQASMATLSVGETPRQAVFGISLVRGSLRS